MSRIKKFQEYLKQKNLTAFLVTSPNNIYYLTKFRGLSPEEREVILVVDQYSAHLYLPRMYKAESKKLKGIKVNLLLERTGIFDLPSQKLKTYSGNIGFEIEDLRVSEFKLLNKNIKKLRATVDSLNNLRLQKESEELAHIKKAVTIADKTFNKIIPFIKPGMSECKIARKLIEIMDEMGSEGPSFYPIVASGKNSALPHHFTSSKKIKNNEPVLLDFGAKVRGYCSDLTRVIYVGKAPKEFKDKYNLVLKTEEELLRFARSGIDLEKLHELTLLMFKDQSPYFLHSTGHGVGLDIHEKPYIREGETGCLLTGAVITIEPGLYYEGLYGIRIEDYGLVTDDEFKVLSKASKKLVEI